MRCNRCGNENPGPNRFCGMCGASLLSETPATTSARPESAAQTATGRDAAGPPARAASPVAQAPSIAGPSFLGLNQPASSSGRGASFGSHLEKSSRNLDYLLEDDEEPHGRAGKIFVILVALALAVGLGYLRWSHQGLSTLLSSPKKSPSTAQTPDSSQPSGDTGAASNPPDSAAAAPSTNVPASSPAAAPGLPAAAESAPAASASSNASQGNAAAGNPPAAAPDAGSAGAAANAPPAETSADKNTDSAAASSETNDKDKDKEASDEQPAAPSAAPRAKPRATAKPTPARAFDQVIEAEKYIYGRGGAHQDCDRGMRMLRPAAEQANARAMISLGALYSTGVCAPRDLPTAYRWFALALRKEPDNQPLQENLQRLWAQMTAPERQLAIKLSQ